MDRLFIPGAKMRKRASLVLLAALLGLPTLLDGCAVPSTVATRKADDNVSVFPEATDKSMATIKGSLMIPTSVALDKSLSFANTATLSGDVVPARSVLNVSDYQLQQAAAQPLPVGSVVGARVFLADASGQPLPNLRSVTTGPNGSFNFPQVPHGFTFMIVAQVKTETGAVAEFRTMAKLTPLGVVVDVSPASTLVTTNLLDGFDGSELGEFQPAKFLSATNAVAKRLTSDNVPDFSSIESIRSSIARLSQDIGELKSMITDMRRDLGNIQQSFDRLQQTINNSRIPTPQPPIPSTTARPTPNVPVSPIPSGPINVRPSGLPTPPISVVSPPAYRTCQQEYRSLKVTDSGDQTFVARVEFRESTVPGTVRPEEQFAALDRLAPVGSVSFLRGMNGNNGVATTFVPIDCEVVMIYRNEQGNVLGWLWPFRIPKTSDPDIKNIVYPLPPLKWLKKPYPVPSGAPFPYPVPSGAPFPYPVPSGAPFPYPVPTGTLRPSPIPTGTSKPN